MHLRIKVKPNSKTDQVITDSDGWKIKIKAQPVEGKANKYLIEYLAEVLKLPKSKVILLKGETNSFKTLQIEAEESYVTELLKKASAL
jgi:uncharacterized protein (TIGR00251 family)